MGRGPWGFHGGAAALAALWVVVLLPALRLMPGDEGVYVYDARRVLEGAVPYRDFFFAHPPLRLLLGALGWVGGATGAKAWAAVGTVAAAWMAGAVVRREAGTGWGLLTVGLVLGSMLSLRTGTQLLGSNLAMAFVAGSMLAAARGRCGLAGVVLGLGALQALYVLLALPGLALWSWERRGRFLAGLAAGLVPLGGCAVLFGGPFVEQVLLYHLCKVGATGLASEGEPLLAFAVGDVGLLAFGLAGLSAAGAGRLAAATGFVAAAVVTAYRSPEVYYFAPALPPLAVASALGLRHLAGRLPPLAGRAVVVGAVALTYVPHALHVPELRAELRVMRADLDRVIGAATGGVVWGDMFIAPWLAAETGRRVAADEVDTSVKRLLTGMAEPGELAERALAEADVVVLGASGLLAFPEVAEQLRAWPAPARLDLAVLPPLLVWRRN